MLLPSTLYGPYKPAVQNVRKALTRVRNGMPWNDAMREAGEVDTAGHSGLLLLNGPNPLLGADDHFHLFLPLTELSRQRRNGRFPPEREEDIFTQCLLSPDGLLGLLAPANLAWVYPENRRESLLQAVLQHWGALDAIGERYSIGMATGSFLWDLPTNIKFVLANMGLDMQTLNAPLPNGGIAELLAQFDPAHPRM